MLGADAALNFLGNGDVVENFNMRAQDIRLVGIAFGKALADGEQFRANGGSMPLKRSEGRVGGVRFEIRFLCFGCKRAVDKRRRDRNPAGNRCSSQFHSRL